MIDSMSAMSAMSTLSVLPAISRTSAIFSDVAVSRAAGWPDIGDTESINP
ncbi:hypothetical protein [Micromonospora sp. NPDC005161]